jgi:hypothetical protein
MRMKWPENNHSPINKKAYLAIPAMLCQESCYRQYTAEKIEKVETSMKRERLWLHCLA